jgi:DNA-binding response OmpR family regulator
MSAPRPLRILVVDDDRVLNNEVVARLTRSGFFPEQAFDGESALEKLNTPFDFVILDLVMPGLSGFEVLKEMQKRNLTMPVVVLSTLRQEEDVERAKKFGARECFAKAVPNFMDAIVEYAEKVSTE